MRRICVLAMILAATMALPLPVGAKLVKGSRQYVTKERQIIKAKKQLVQEEREVKEFEGLLATMDNVLEMGGATRNFWTVNAAIRRAMEREHDECEKRLAHSRGDKTVASVKRQEAGVDIHVDEAVRQADETSAEETPEARLDRMETIIVESNGLQHWMAEGDMDVVKRYRFLLGEFVDLMWADVAAARAQISAEERILNGDE